jgi:hypothetical protein
VQNLRTAPRAVNTFEGSVGCCPVLSPAVILCTEKFESPVYLFVHATLSYDLLIL